jgi:hypothetical protein
VKRLINNPARSLSRQKKSVNKNRANRFENQATTSSEQSMELTDLTSQLVVSPNSVNQAEVLPRIFQTTKNKFNKSTTAEN